MKLKSFANTGRSLLGAKLPIIQGGMGVGISLAGLAGAVANQGGIGVISAAAIGMEEPDFFRNFLEANIRALRREIRKAREATKGILGVNIMVATSNFVDMVKVAVEEAIDVIFAGAGLAHEPARAPGRKQEDEAGSDRILRESLPDHLPALAGEAPLPARRGCCRRTDGGRAPRVQSGADQRSELRAGEDRPRGHRRGAILREDARQRDPRDPGRRASTRGADMVKYLEMGAAGVQMATRFVTTDECDASIEFKRLYIEAKEEDLVIIKSPVGMPGRAIRNQFIDDVSKGMRKPYKCPYHCLITCDYKNTPYCIALALMNAKKGNLENGFAFAGANAFREKDDRFGQGADGRASGRIRGRDPSADRAGVGAEVGCECADIIAPPRGADPPRAREIAEKTAARR